LAAFYEVIYKFSTSFPKPLQRAHSEYFESMQAYRDCTFISIII
jgi:hypothetical protein